MVLYFLTAFDDVEAHLDNLWLMVAMATRYGHQPISEIHRMTIEQLARYNNSLAKLIERENSSGRGMTGRLAEGGG